MKEHAMKDRERLSLSMQYHGDSDRHFDLFLKSHVASWTGLDGQSLSLGPIRSSI